MIDKACCALLSARHCPKYRHVLMLFLHQFCEVGTVVILIYRRETGDLERLSKLRCLTLCLIYYDWEKIYLYKPLICKLSSWWN